MDVTAWQVVAGVVLVLVPIVWFARIMVRDMGWRAAATAWAIAVIGTGSIVGGVFLFLRGIGME